MADSSIGTAVQPTLVVVGAATRDIAADDPRGWKLGGGVTYSAIAAARLPVSVKALIGVDELAATAQELDAIRRSGVDVRLVQLPIGPVFDNRRTPNGRRQFAVAPSDPLSVADLPEEWRSPGAALLAPVAGELSQEWSTAFAPATYLTLAAQGLLRRLHPGREVVRLAFEHGPIIQRADAIALSREDVSEGAPPIRDWTHAGQTLLITHGKRGSLALERTETGLTGRFMPPLPPRRAIDPTGAGDTFVAAWLAARMVVGSGWRALAVASAMSSLAVLSASMMKTPTTADLCAVLYELRQRS
ncbi:MAG TPA: PfkB family carbohydrate kinase [Candidatus Limnocylindrales bacterium]